MQRKKIFEEKEIIRLSPFDATFNRTATLEDIDEKKVKNFVARARIKRNFPFDESADYKNRLEIWNPGQLPFGLTIEMLKTEHPSKPTNPLLARPMYLYGSIEHVGSGTEMLVEKCLVQGLREPEFRQELDFITIFWRKEDREDTEKVTEKDTEKITLVQKIILQEISNNKFITILDLSEKVKINVRNTKSNIAKLKAKGLLERIGPDKGGYWKVIK